MLLRFGTKNFKSLRDEQELSLVGTDTLREPASNLIRVDGVPGGVLRCAAIFGANASGKTNVLNALDFLIRCVRDSQTNWKPDAPIPRTPFLLDDNRNQPSRFWIDFMLDSVRYEYGFTIDSFQVLEEYLDAWVTGGRKQKWFDRKQDQKIYFGKKLTGENRVIETLTRKNSLFLSAAAQNNHSMLLPLHNFLTSRITVLLRDRTALNIRIFQNCLLDSNLKAALLDHLKAADLGIVDFELREEDWGDEKNPFLVTLRNAFRKAAEENPEAKLMDRMNLRHKSKNGQSIALPISEESSGTSAYFGLLGACLGALNSGNLICIDELNASLHPLLAMNLVRSFNSPSNNRHNAQLIFNTHDTNLLRREILRRDQIWFTEKDEEGATHLYPLTDFKTRQHMDLEKGYLEGRYGGIPFISGHDWKTLMAEVD